MSNVQSISTTGTGITVTPYTPYISWPTPLSLGGTSLQTSNSIVKISAALNKAQRNIGSATKGSANPFFKSKYADLGSVMEACKEALNDQGISVLQPVVSDATGDYVETMLLHESGEFLASRMKLLVAKPNMQEFGSAVSYARRYGLQSMVFIPAEDDDGEKSMRRSTPAPTRQAVVATPLPNEEDVPVDLSTLKGPLPAAPAAAPVEPLKKSSFKKPKKAAETPAAEESSDWS